MRMGYVGQLNVVALLAIGLLNACDKGEGGESEAPTIGECALNPDYTDVEILSEGSFTHVNGLVGQIEHSRDGQEGVVTAMAMQLVPNDGGQRLFALRSVSSSDRVRLHSIEIHLDDGEVLQPASRCELTPTGDAVACFFTEVDMLRLMSACHPTIRIAVDGGEPFDFDLDESKRALVAGVIEPHQSQ